MLDTSSTSTKTVLSDQAYKAVRSAILTGTLPFGTQLVVRELSEILDLSPTPIKSALTTLESEGLVIAIPYRGFFVPSFDVSDVLEIYSVREALERKAARLTALHADKNTLNKLANILRQQKEAAAEGNTEKHIDLDLKFHKTIAEATRNQRLVDLCNTILGQAHLIIASAAISVGRYKDIEQEHQRILKAIQSKDANEAETAVWQHNQNASLSLIEHYQKDQEPIIDFSNNTLITTESILNSLQQNKAHHHTNTQTLDESLSEQQKGQIREALVEFVGPMATFVVRDALSKTNTISNAISLISSKIPKEKDAKAFTKDITELLDNT